MLVLNLKSADKRYKQRGGNPRVISRSCIATSQLMLMNFPRQAIAILLFFKGIAIAWRTLRGMRPEQKHVWFSVHSQNVSSVRQGDKAMWEPKTGSIFRGKGERTQVEIHYRSLPGRSATLSWTSAYLRGITLDSTTEQGIWARACGCLPLFATANSWITGMRSFATCFRIEKAR